MEDNNLASSEPVSIPGGSADSDATAHEARQALRSSLFKGKGDSQSNRQDGDDFDKPSEGVADEGDDRVESELDSTQSAPADKDTPDAPAKDSASPDPDQAQELPHRKLGYKSEDDLAKALQNTRAELTRRAQADSARSKEIESLKQLLAAEKQAKTWSSLEPKEQDKLDEEAAELGLTGKALWTLRAERQAEKAKEAADRLQHQQQLTERQEAELAQARLDARADWVASVEALPDYAEFEDQLCQELEKRPAFFRILGQLEPDEIREFGAHYIDLFRRANPAREKKLREEGRQEARQTKVLKKLSSGSEAGRGGGGAPQVEQRSSKSTGKPKTAVDRMVEQRRQSEESWA